MRPAFSSIRQAAAFALLLLILLLSPVFAGKRFLPPRAEAYSSLTWRFGDFGFLYQQIFQQKGDIDIAFIGSSRMWAGIDTPYVEQELSKRLGRPAVVRTLAWNWLGCDADFFITQDLLQNRKVHMIVIDDEFRADEPPHVAATHWFRLGDNAAALRGLPPRIQSSFFFAAILGMPRNLLSLVRPNLPEILASTDIEHWREAFHAPNPCERAGSLSVKRWEYADAPFSAYAPHGNALPSDIIVYSPATSDQFKFSGLGATSWQHQFVKKLAILAQENNVKLVFLHLTPVYSDNETNNLVIQERECWPLVLNTNLSLIGIPPEKLYSGIAAADLPKLFYTPDFYHFNQNGQKFFTPLITPTLFHIYETEATH